MFFNRITVNARSADADELAALVKGNVYAVHEILWRLFPEDPHKKRDFLFRKETRENWPFFYMVSKRRPQSLKGLLQVETKPYGPKLTNGQQLSFSLRANPVVAKKTGDGRKIARHDVVMNAKHDLSASSTGKTNISMGELQYAAGIKWLNDRADRLGFDFDPGQVRVFGYQQYRIKSRKQKDLIRFSTLDYSGILTVTESERFNRTLVDGVGRAKAFGCGLLLVRLL